MKLSSSAPPAQQPSRKSSSHVTGLVSPLYLTTLVGGRKRWGKVHVGCTFRTPTTLFCLGWDYDHCRSNGPLPRVRVTTSLRLWVGVCRLFCHDGHMVNVGLVPGLLPGNEMLRASWLGPMRLIIGSRRVTGACSGHLWWLEYGLVRAGTLAPSGNGLVLPIHRASRLMHGGVLGKTVRLG